MKKLFTLLLVTIITLNVNAWNVYIPDTLFKQALISRGIDLNNDGEIQVSEAQNTESLNVNNRSISDLTGIGSFTELIRLDCEGNQLTTLDLSKNTELIDLFCSNNNISFIDFGDNTLLTFMACDNNNLINLDISRNTGLERINCSSNQLTSLNIFNNHQIIQLNCVNNPAIQSICLDHNQFELTTSAADYWLKDTTAIWSDYCIYSNLTNISCFGDHDGIISFSTYGYDSPITYNWSTGASTSNLPNLSTGLYAVTITHDSMKVYSSNFSITEPKLLMLSSSISDSIVCNFDHVTITALPINGVTPYSYLWNTGNTQASFSHYPYDSTTYYVTVTDQNGCTATSNVFVSVIPSPPVFYHLDNMQGCAPLTVDFFNGGTDLGHTYIWDFGDGSNSTSSEDSPSHTYATAGVYEISVKITTPTNSCERDTSVNNFIYVYESPTANFTASSSTFFNPNITFTNLSTGYDYFQWRFGDGTYTEWDENPIHGYPHADYYDVSLTVMSEHGCSDTASMQIHAYKGDAQDVNELDTNDLSIYPIPATSTLHISNIQEAQKVQICNLTGEIALEEIISEQLDISTLKAGGYILKLLNENNEVVGIKKFIKQ